MTPVEIRMMAEKTARETGRPDVILLGEFVAQQAEMNEILREIRSFVAPTPSHSIEVEIDGVVYK